MQHGTPAQAELVRHAIEQGDLTRFGEVLQIVQETGALDYTRQQAMRETAAAHLALNVLPDSEYKQALLDLAEFAATREF
jgi:octaprenyl-diphosphate synthase